MKIRPDEANLSDLLRRFNLPLPTGPQRAAGTGTATAQALPKPAGSKGAPATPATAGGPGQTAPRPGAASPATSGSASTPTEPNLDTLLDAVGSFVSGAAADAAAPLTPEPRSNVRASQRPQQQPSNGRAAPGAESDAGQESRFVSRVSPQVIARPGLLAPTSQKGAPDPQAAQAQQAEPRATAELPRHELSARAEQAEIQAEMPNQSALSPRAPGLEASTMQHWAAVEVSARALPRNVRGDVTATPSDPPRKGGRRRGGGATENDWFGARVVRSNAYAVVFTLLGLLTLFVMARSCS